MIDWSKLGDLFGNIKLHNAFQAHKKHDDREPLASYIESGGDLSELSDEEREILARFVRTGKRRTHEKVPPILRNREICDRLAYLGGRGYSRPESIRIAAQEFDVSTGTIRKTIWPNRGKFGGEVTANFYDGKIDRQLEQLDRHVKARLEHEETYGGLRPSVTVSDMREGLPAWADERDPEILAECIHDAIIKHGWTLEEQDGEARYKPGI